MAEPSMERVKEFLCERGHRRPVAVQLAEGALHDHDQFCYECLVFGGTAWVPVQLVTS